MVPKMSSVIVPEDLLAPEPALPIQFHEIWHRTRFITSERDGYNSPIALRSLRAMRYS